MVVVEQSLNAIATSRPFPTGSEKHFSEPAGKARAVAIEIYMYTQLSIEF